MAQEWNIKPRATACGGCNKSYLDGDAYWSALRHGPEGYERTDYCLGCWADRRGDTSAHSAWQGLYREPPPPEAEPLRKETAESLLRRMMEDPESVNPAAMFILAVMLERKRIFIERDVQVDDDGLVTRIYEHRKTGETFLIPDPQLKLDQLEAVQAEVVTLLEGRAVQEPS